MTPNTFFETFFAGTEHNVNLRAIHPDKPPRETFVRGTEEILRFGKEHADAYNVYFGVATRNGGGKKEHIREIVGIHADIDFKTTPREDAEARLASFPLPPTFVVETGGGLHAYWLLNEPGGPEDIPRVEAINKGIARILGGDLAACDASRVLRVPGTLNHKYEPVRAVTVAVAGAHPDRRYDLDDFEAYTDHEAPTETPATTTAEFDAALLEDALRSIPADDREDYVTVIRAVKLSAEEAGFPANEAKELVRAWARTSAKYKEHEFEKRWEKDFKREKGKVQRLGTVYRLAAEHGWAHPDKLRVEDFHAYMPMHNYIFKPTREFWPATSVNRRVPKVKVPHGLVDAASWLDRHRPVEQVTWHPGLPEIIEDRVIAEGGWIEYPGVKALNLYRPPRGAGGGDPAQAGPWRDHLAHLYPEEHRHVERWLAHRVQYPDKKINHGLICGGSPGIGKDTVFVPIRRAVGDWNVREVSPVNLVESFNDWCQSVILRVSEARDLGGNDLAATNRYALYEHMKTLTAAPPEVLRVNQKHVRQFYITNVVGVIVTTNYRDGMYLPPDDRRFFVAWSELSSGDFNEGYWTGLYEWYARGGDEHVTAYLASLDLSDFNPKAPPPWTAAKEMMVDAGRDDNLSPIGDALDRIKEAGFSIDAVTLTDLATRVDSEDVRVMLTGGGKSARRVPHLMEACGYVKVVNEYSPSDGKWRVDGKRQIIYARRQLSLQERRDAARTREQRGPLPARDKVPF